MPSQTDTLSPFCILRKWGVSSRANLGELDRAVPCPVELAERSSRGSIGNPRSDATTTRVEQGLLPRGGVLLVEWRNL